ncbi:MAG: 16S rRNA (uracil(1498)-N(3))-methyltransferase, partial [Gammaproteobacteria bacterium]
MRIPRIHHPASLSSGTRIELSDIAANHVARVLRLAAGAPLILFNGEGGEFAATVTDIDKRTVTVAVGDFQP